MPDVKKAVKRNAKINITAPPTNSINIVFFNVFQKIWSFKSSLKLPKPMNFISALNPDQLCSDTYKACIAG